MAKKLIICSSLLIFVLASSVGTGEQFSPNINADFRSSLSVDRQNSSPDIDYGSLVLNRFMRGKSSVKSLPSFNTTKQEISLLGWTNETSVSGSFSKYRVYQHINVYRL